MFVIVKSLQWTMSIILALRAIVRHCRFVFFVDCHEGYNMVLVCTGDENPKPI